MRALATAGTGVTVYAGGDFTAAGGVSANFIAKWNGSAWSSLTTSYGNGMTWTVYALGVDRAGNLYAGGRFTTAGVAGANRIAKWDGATWTPLGSGINDYVYAVAVDDTGKLYAGGYFTTAGGKPSSRIAQWREDVAHKMLWLPLVFR